MKINLKYIMQRLALLFVVAGLVFMSSCEDDEDLNSGEIVLLSFGPSGVVHGDEVIFVGKNLDKVSSIVFRPDITVERAEFVEASGESFKVVVPQGAEAGKVLLNTPQGQIESKTFLNFEVDVVISSITTEAKPGTNISIKGTKINWIESVTFSSDLVVEKADFVSRTLTELVVTVPMEAQTGFLIFSTGGTDPLTFVSEEELIVTVPTVSSFSPDAIKHTGKLTITGTDLDLVTSIVFVGDTVTEFVSQSATKIELTVPAKVEKGALILKQASPIDVLVDGELTIILPVGTTLSPQPAEPGVDEITITGTNLDLVKSLTFPGIEALVPASAFTSHTATEIVLTLPDGSKAGGIKYTTIHDYTNNLGVNVVLPGPGPLPLAITLYDDELSFGGVDGSWNASLSDLGNTEQAYSGTKSWKHVAIGGDGGAKAQSMTGVDATGMGVYVFSLYGGPGTDGKQVAAVLGSGGADKWDSYNSVTLVEGEWTEYRIELTNYPTVDLSDVTIFIFKVEGATDAVLYVDRVGFDPAGPPPLDYYIYDDALQNGWGEWGGWDHDVQDFANEEEVFKGSKAIKMVFNGQYGAVQFGAPATDVLSGYTTLSFWVHVAEAQDIMVQPNNAGDVYLSIPAGWSQVEVPIASLAENDNLTEIRIKNNNATLPVTMYIDEIGLKY